MDVLNISLPETLKEYVTARVSQGDYGSASDYISALIQADQRNAARATLEAELLKGLEGEASEMTKEDWANLRARAAGTHKKI